MASPSSAAATSDVEPTSPAERDVDQSFVSAAGDRDGADRNETEDEGDTRMGDGSPAPTPNNNTQSGREGSGREGTATGGGRGGGRGSRRSGAARGGDKDKDKDSQQAIIGKVRHLKKEDGEPLWRKDIQYDFLKAIFDDEQAVFTNSYEPHRKQNFADLYIDTMSRSSKTSKVLRDKLLMDRDAAKGMAMVCLLVNIGRMNTTLNFFPEMRAQLRTYHAIPSLQAQQDPHAYKQLQDAPRLKSILKGGAEDRDEPTSLEKIKRREVPRTNPVNLLFVICQTAAKIAELHFPPGREFHDLVMRTQLTSKSRARAFLWLMWFYLQSDFTEEGCDENPFGAGVDYGVDVANQGVPELIEMTAEEEALENVDPPEEIEFGAEKQRMRAKILEADMAFLAESQSKRGTRAPRIFNEEGPAILPRIRPSKHESDMDSTRSTPPPRVLAGRGLGGGNAGSSTRRGGAALKYQIFEGSSPAAHRGENGQAFEGIVARKPRPPTAHQLAVERNRNQRVEYILDRGLRRQHHKSRKVRRQDGAVFRAQRRVREMADPFIDSDEETTGFFASVPLSAERANQSAFRERGLGALQLLTTEEDDFGEEVASYSAALRRATRRLKRWTDSKDPDVIRPIKRHKSHPNGVNGTADEDDPDHDEDLRLAAKYGGGPSVRDIILKLSQANGRRGSAANGDITMEDIDEAEAEAEELANKTGALGDDEDDDNEDLDPVERGLLGLDEIESEA